VGTLSNPLFLGCRIIERRYRIHQIVDSATCYLPGGCPSSLDGLNYVLSRPGNAVALIVGGASESLDSRPGLYKVTLKRRKGFVKLALMHG
jgi:hypothetical protein